jgi:hypothetical protein
MPITKNYLLVSDFDSELLGSHALSRKGGVAFAYPPSRTEGDRDQGATYEYLGG